MNCCLLVCWTLTIPMLSRALDISVLSDVMQNATVNETFVLRCKPTVSPGKPVRWMYQKDDESVADEISFGEDVINGFVEHFELDKSTPGEYNLVMKRATYNDSGIYACIEDYGQGDIHLIRLTVVQPVITANEEKTLSISSTTSSAAKSQEETSPKFPNNEICTWIHYDKTIVILGLSLFVLTCVCILMLLTIGWLLKKTGCVAFRPRGQYARNDGAQELLLVNDAPGAWNEIAEIEQKVYMMRERNPGHWTNNRFVTSVVKLPTLFRTLLSRLEEYVRKNKVDAIVGFNSDTCRSEPIAAPLALLLNLPYVSISKAVKGSTTEDMIQQQFKSRLGEHVTLEVANDNNLYGKNVVLINSCYVTGRAMKAAKELIQNKLKATVVETIVFTKVTDLQPDEDNNPAVRALFSHNDTATQND